MSHRKHRRRVEHGAVHGGNDVGGKSRKSVWTWRGNRKKTGMVDTIEIPSITIVVTPPTPTITPRCVKKDSIGSSSDLIRSSSVAVTKTTTSNSAGSDAKGNDVTSDSDVSESEQSSNNASTCDVTSATSLAGIRDVTLMTELSSEGLLEDDPCSQGKGQFVAARQQLSSMERSGTTKNGFVMSSTDNGKDCSGQG